MAALLVTKSDRKESSRLNIGFLKLTSTYVGGDDDCLEGTLMSIVLLMLTTGHLLSNDETTVDKHSDSTKRMVDTNNACCPDRAILAMVTTHTMKDHIMQMACQLIVGAFATVSLTKLGQKVIKLGMVNWLPLGSGSIKRALDNLE